MAARIAIVVVCCAAIAGLATRLREHDRCQSAQTMPNPATLTSDCRDPDAIASASALLLSAGERDQALRLARESVQREPDSFVGWVAMALALRDRDPAGAQRAIARAKTLNPRWQGLPPAATPRSP